MTSRSRRNRRITTPRRWTPISAWAAALALVAPPLVADPPPGDAPFPGVIDLPALGPLTDRVIKDAPMGNGELSPAADAIVESLPAQGPQGKPSSDSVDVASSIDFDREHAKTMQRLASLDRDPKVVHLAQAPPRAPLGPSNDVPYQVNTEPPTRDRLFRVLSPESYLRRLENDYRASGQTSPFFLPLPVDLFDSPNAPTLSALWFQSRKTGPVDPNTRLSGFIGIVDNAAQHDAGEPREVAIYNESVGSSDMSVTITVELGGPTSQVGAVVRAGEPRRWVDNVDQIDVNQYYYALFTESSVAVWFHQPGKEDRLLKRADLSPKSHFIGEVTVFDATIRVLRDTQVVLEVQDDSVPAAERGKYCGMIAGPTEGGPTRILSFIGRRYGGEYVARQWDPTAAIFRGPNVHYYPLYFEQVALERYGQHFGNLFAPWCAHLMFFADAALLPYSIGKSPPWACHNDVGFFKPGDIVPFRIYRPVCDTNGSVLQATAMALSWALIP